MLKGLSIFCLGIFLEGQTLGSITILAQDPCASVLSSHSLSRVPHIREAFPSEFILNFRRALKPRSSHNQIKFLGPDQESNDDAALTRLAEIEVSFLVLPEFTTATNGDTFFELTGHRAIKKFLKLFMNRRSYSIISASETREAIDAHDSLISTLNKPKTDRSFEEFQAALQASIKSDAVFLERGKMEKKFMEDSADMLAKNAGTYSARQILRNQELRRRFSMGVLFSGFGSLAFGAPPEFALFAMGIAILERIQIIYSSERKFNTPGIDQIYYLASGLTSFWKELSRNETAWIFMNDLKSKTHKVPLQHIAFNIPETLGIANFDLLLDFRSVPRLLFMYRAPKKNRETSAVH